MRRNAFHLLKFMLSTSVCRIIHFQEKLPSSADKVKASGKAGGEEQEVRKAYSRKERREGPVARRLRNLTALDCSGLGTADMHSTDRVSLGRVTFKIHD